MNTVRAEYIPGLDAPAVPFLPPCVYYRALGTTLEA